MPKYLHCFVVCSQGSYVVFAVVPPGVQLFVKERLHLGLLEVCGFLLHCQRLPLWTGPWHTRHVVSYAHATAKTPQHAIQVCVTLHAARLA